MIEKSWPATSGDVSNFTKEKSALNTLIKAIANLTTDMKAVEDMTRDKRFGFKIMALLFNSPSHEVHLESMKIIKNIVQHE